MSGTGIVDVVREVQIPLLAVLLVCGAAAKAAHAVGARSVETETGPTVMVTGVPWMIVPGSPAAAVRMHWLTGRVKFTWYCPSANWRAESTCEPRARVPSAETTAKSAACEAPGARSAPAAIARPTQRRREPRAGVVWMGEVMRCP